MKARRTGKKYVNYAAMNAKLYADWAKENNVKSLAQVLFPSSQIESVLPCTQQSQKEA